MSADYLFVQLTTTPQPASGSQVLTLSFYKTTGQPTSAYQLTDIELKDSANPNSAYYTTQSGTVAAGSSGSSYSGTFTGKASVLVNGSYQTTHTLTAGTFTNAH